ncbi:MAG: protease SohB, partial [Spongiibacteraceae bacterium]
MEFLLEYGLFLAKALTLVVAILFVVSAVAALGQRGRPEGAGHIAITPLHERIEDWAEALNEEMLEESELKALRKEKKRLAKQEKKHPPEPKKRLFVLDFDGDIKASEVENLREEITAILSIAKDSDEVLLRLESPGGMVHSYGLAASQLQRIRSKKLKLTIAVDRVAASGGYMMACIGDEILAAPFAVIGSVGVVAQLPNFNRLLKKHDVDVELHTAGEHKRTLTMIGENTEEG